MWAVGRCRKSKGKRQKAKVKNQEPQLIRGEDVFIFAFLLFAF